MFKLEMPSVENKPPAFNNLVSQETACAYFVHVTLTLNGWHWPRTGDLGYMQGPSYYNWWLFNLYIQNLTFYFHDLELNPMTLGLKPDLDDMVVQASTLTSVIPPKRTKIVNDRQFSKTIRQKTWKSPGRCLNTTRVTDTIHNWWITLKICPSNDG